MKQYHVMEDVEKSVEDKAERKKLLDGMLGYIFSCTQVQLFHFIAKVCLFRETQKHEVQEDNI